MLVIHENIINLIDELECISLTIEQNKESKEIEQYVKSMLQVHKDTIATLIALL